MNVQAVINALLPTRCPLCRQHLTVESGLCQTCAQRLQPELDGNLVHLGRYARLGQAVKALKFREFRTLSRPLGEALAAGVLEAGWRVDAVVPVPLHAARLRERGFNQAMLLAVALAEALEVPVLDALERQRPTARQMNLGLERRLANVQGVFKLKPNQNISNQELIVLDDVFTSGSTGTEATLELLRAGAKRVRMAVVARTKK